MLWEEGGLISFQNDKRCNETKVKKLQIGIYYKLQKKSHIFVLILIYLDNINRLIGHRKQSLQQIKRC